MRSRFFDKKFEFLTIAQVLDITGARLVGDCDTAQRISDVATLEKATFSEISFVNSGQYLEKFLNSKVGFCLLEEKYASKAPQGMVALIHKNPYFAYAQIAASFYQVKKPNFSTTSNAKIGEGTVVAPNAYVGNDVEIGKNCVIAPGASIMEGCVIGDGCVINANATVSFAMIGKNSVIYSGARIGQDGFGFAHDSGVNHKIIQIGIVEIGSDVEVGANSCVDRGAIGNTVIGDGVKIDNLVQIAHNVAIGRGTVIAGCAGIAGSTSVGNFVQIGGGASISGHISIGDGAKVAGMSVVIRDVLPMQIVAGIPSVPIKQWHRINALLIKQTKAGLTQSKSER